MRLKAHLHVRFHCAFLHCDFELFYVNVETPDSATGSGAFSYNTFGEFSDKILPNPPNFRGVKDTFSSE
jgi:hypothetical protein